MSMPSAASTTVIPDGHSAQLFGVADSRAQIAAELQAAGKPWPCPHHKVHVTNEKCREMKIAGDTRQCQNCGLPLSLNIVTREELKMAKGTCDCCGATAVMYRHGGVSRCYSCHKTKAEPMDMPSVKKSAEDPTTASEGIPVSGEVAEKDSGQGIVLTASQIVAEAPPGIYSPELSWDDFIDIAPYRQPEQLSAHIRAGEYLTISVGIVRKLGWSHGDGVLVRRDAAGNALALCHDGAYAKGKNLKVTAGSNNSAALRVCCSQALKDVAAKSGSHRVTVTPWGVVIHLDRPVEGKA